MFAEIRQLKARIATLEEEVRDLRTSAVERDVIVLRTVTRDEAKREVAELFESGQTLVFSDVARKLRLDLPLVVEICQELLEEEEIEVDADAV
jgi:hypothetical protein